MTLDPQPDTVISFGDDRPVRRTFLRDLGTDRRLPVLTAGVGGVAAFGSLISEWQTTTMNGLAFGGELGAAGRILPTDLIDLGGVGAGYLTGLLVLVIAVVLTFFGPTAGRRYARLTGIATGGVLLALLLALVHHLSETTLLIPRYYTLELSGDDIRVALGRGLWCALAAVGAALIALWVPAPSAEHADHAEPGIENPAQDPLGLTITSAEPFVVHRVERDQPYRS